MGKTQIDPPVNKSGIKFAGGNEAMLFLGEKLTKFDPAFPVGILRSFLESLPASRWTSLVQPCRSTVACLPSAQSLCDVDSTAEAASSLRACARVRSTRTKAAGDFLQPQRHRRVRAAATIKRRDHTVFLSGAISGSTALIKSGARHVSSTA
jgi:hypothetical protein